MESENNIDRLMQGIAKMAGEMLGDMCSIMLLNTHNEMYHIAALYDKDPEAVALIHQLLKDVVDIPRDQGNAAKVIRSGKPLLQPAPSVEEIKAAAIPSLTECRRRSGSAACGHKPPRCPPLNQATPRPPSAGRIHQKRHRMRRPSRQRRASLGRERLAGIGPQQLCAEGHTFVAIRIEMDRLLRVMVADHQVHICWRRAM